MCEFRMVAAKRRGDDGVDLDWGTLSDVCMGWITGPRKNRSTRLVLWRWKGSAKPR